MQTVLNIALPIAIDKIFSYMLPENFGKENLIGKRALVPFKNQSISGVIIGVNSEIPEYNLKYIYEIIDSEPVISPKMIEFAEWISEYYMTGLGETLKLFMPPGVPPKSVQQIKISSNLNKSNILKIKNNAPKQVQILEKLFQFDDFISFDYLKKLLNDTNINSQIKTLADENIIEIKTVISNKKSHKYQKAIKLNNYNELQIKDYIKEIDKTAPKQALMLSILFHEYKTGNKKILLNPLLEKLNTSHSVANALKRKELAEIYDVKIDRTTIEEDKLSDKNELTFNLTEEQEKIINDINTDINNNYHKPNLIYGITGSGKTLIYLHIINSEIKAGKNSLYIVPEISLTPQLIDRFENVFPGQIAVLHSKMSEGERFDSWYKILNNESKIIIGARSAIFAPIQNLGLIIVDEEHDKSFKQDSPNPKYNARDIAIVRANIENCPIILGSATPAFESYHNAIKGKYKLHKLLKRADNAKLPEIDIIDMKTSDKYAQSNKRFSSYLINNIIDRINKKERIILLQNRRGFSASLFCEECGFIPICKNCDISMTYHKRNNILKCHYCGYTENTYTSCPHCGNPDLQLIGYGTQRIEDELEEILISNNIEANIERFDLDTTSKKGSHRKILHRFMKGETDILIGTQMVAKGIDFDKVTLIGILSADIQLFIPDFRASEKTFSLLTQVSGRAGRSSKYKGKVIIQTYNPENNAILMSKTGDYNKFFNQEISEREKALYPPFTRFIVIEFKSKFENLCNHHSKLFMKYLNTNHKAYRVLGPNIPDIPRIKNFYRRNIIIKDIKNIDKSGKIIRKHLNYAYEEYQKNHKTSKVKLSIDIDSQSIF